MRGRNEQQVRDQDLSAYMMKLGDFKVNYADSSVTGSIFGMAKRKAIYRNGLGATVVSELDEQQIRSQQMTLPTKPQVNTDTIAWPMGDRITGSFPEAFDSSKLQSAIENIFKEKDTILPIRTRAVVVVYNGQVIAEHYADGFNAHTKLAGWSMTKICYRRTHRNTGETGKITILMVLHLYPNGSMNMIRDMPSPSPIYLQQRSGLDFEEIYAKASDATRMLYRKGRYGRFYRFACPER